MVRPTVEAGYVNRWLSRNIYSFYRASKDQISVAKKLLSIVSTISHHYIGLSIGIDAEAVECGQIVAWLAVASVNVDSKGTAICWTYLVVKPSSWLSHNNGQSQVIIPRICSSGMLGTQPV